MKSEQDSIASTSQTFDTDDLIPFYAKPRLVLNQAKLGPKPSEAGSQAKPGSVLS